jgi:hypothetical protein
MHVCSQRYPSWIVLYVTGKGVFRQTADGEVLMAEYGARAAKYAAARKRRYEGDQSSEEDAISDDDQLVKLTKLHEVRPCPLRTVERRLRAGVQCSTLTSPFRRSSTSSVKRTAT